MSIHHIVNVGSTPHEAPESVWEILVEVLFNPKLSAAEIEHLQTELWERLEETIRETLGPHAYGNSGADVTTVRGRGENTPLFPIIAGDTRFTCNLDVAEMVERTCQGTDLAQVAYDVRGRAYELGVEIDYLRRPRLDGTRRAELPDPDKVEQAGKKRRRNKP